MRVDTRAVAIKEWAARCPTNVFFMMAHLPDWCSRPCSVQVVVREVRCRSTQEAVSAPGTWQKNTGFWACQNSPYSTTP